MAKSPRADEKFTQEPLAQFDKQLKEHCQEVEDEVFNHKNASPA